MKTCKSSYLNYLFLCFIALTFSCQVFANHIVSAEIHYKTIDSSKYQIQLTIYRDCNSNTTINPNADGRIKCSTGSIVKSLNYSLLSVEDITPRCGSNKKDCSTQTEGIEQLVYVANVNLDSSYYADLKSCDELIVDYSFCCRNGDIKTIDTDNFYTYASLKRSVSKHNNSPTFRRPYDINFACNTAIRYNLFATDPDGDSLSYELDCPMVATNTCATYKSNYAKDNFGIVYWPGSLKFPYANANANPPIGISLDAETGTLSFTPTNCDETSTFALLVYEWRKNKNNIAEIVGITRREVVYKMRSGNQTPEFDYVRDLRVTEGSTIEFDIMAFDRDCINSNKGCQPTDSVKMKHFADLPGANYQLIDTGIYQSFKVSWTPIGMARKAPYYGLFAIQDNACDINSVNYHQVKIGVDRKVDATLHHKKLNCLQYALSVDFDSITTANNKTVTWQIRDLNGDVSVVKNGSVWFTQSNNFTSNYVIDTLELPLNGRFFIELSVKAENNASSQVFYDTVTSYFNTKNIIDSSAYTICPGKPLQIYPNIDTSKYSKPQWNNPTNPATFSKNIDFYSGNKIQRIKAIDGAGCFAVGWFLPLSIQKLSLTIPAYKRVCFYDSLIVLPIIYGKKIGVWDSFYWNTNSTGQKLTVKESGQYILYGQNHCGLVSDTLTVEKINPITPNLPKQISICKNDSIKLQLKAEYAQYSWSNNSAKPFIYAKTTGYYFLTVQNECETIKDTATIIGYLYPPKIELGEKIETCNTNKISLDATWPGSSYYWSSGDTTPKITAQKSGNYMVMVTNACGFTTDSKNIVYDVPLKVNLGRYISTNQPDTVVLDAKTESARSYLWNNGMIVPKITASDYGKYWVTITNLCGTISDTVIITIPLNTNKIAQNNVMIFPNPNKGSFFIYGLKNIEYADIKVFNQLGHEVNFSKEINPYNDLDELTIEHTNGVYILEIITASGPIHYKVAVGIY